MVISGGAQDGAGAQALASAPRDGADPWRELAELPLPHLRARRRALAGEAASVRHWQRLLRARRDLLVALAGGVEDLLLPLEAASAGGPLDARAAADLAEHGPGDPARALRELVLAPAARPGRLGGELQRVASAQRRLAAYEEALRAELDAATAALAARCGEVLAAG